MNEQNKKTMKVSNSTAALIEAEHKNGVAFFNAVFDALMERYELEDAPSVKEFDALYREFEKFIDKEIASSICDTYEETKGEQI